MGKKKIKSKKKIKTKRSWLFDIPLGACVFFIVVGIILGNVFVILTWHEGKMIDKSEAISVAGVYDSYTVHHSARGSLNEIEIRFIDREKLYMDSAYWNTTVQDALDDLDSGDTVSMLIHPISEYIWEMKTEENTILSFEDAKSGVLAENLGFSIILGTFGCFCAIMGTVSLILQLLERRRKRGNSKK